MLDFDKYFQTAMEKYLVRINFYDDPIYSKRIRKVMDFVMYKFMPVFFSIVSLILLIWIFNRIVTSYGIDKLLVVVSAIFVLNLRNRKD